MYIIKYNIYVCYLRNKKRTQKPQLKIYKIYNIIINELILRFNLINYHRADILYIFYYYIILII